jgi:hypothetical protein
MDEEVVVVVVVVVGGVGGVVVGGLTASHPKVTLKERGANYYADQS